MKWLQRLSITVAIATTSAVKASDPVPPTISPAYTMSYTSSRVVNVGYAAGRSGSSFPTFDSLTVSYDSDDGVYWTKRLTDIQTLAPVYHRTVETREVLPGPMMIGYEQIITKDAGMTPVTNVFQISDCPVYQQWIHGSTNFLYPDPGMTFVVTNFMSDDCTVMADATGGTSGHQYKFRVTFYVQELKVDVNRNLIVGDYLTADKISMGCYQAQQGSYGQVYVDITVPSVAVGQKIYIDMTPLANAQYYQWGYNGVQYRGLAP